VASRQALPSSSEVLRKTVRRETRECQFNAELKLEREDVRSHQSQPGNKIDFKIWKFWYFQNIVKIQTNQNVQRLKSTNISSTWRPNKFGKY